MAEMAGKADASTASKASSPPLVVAMGAVPPAGKASAPAAAVAAKVAAPAPLAPSAVVAGKAAAPLLAKLHRPRRCFL